MVIQKEFQSCVGHEQLPFTEIIQNFLYMLLNYMGIILYGNI